MSLITRTYTFTDGATAYGSQVDSEIANIVNTLNSLDQGNTTWTNVKVTTLLPQADVSAGGHKITNLGTPGTSGDAAVYPITASQITAGTITTTQIASSTITGSNIASSTITASKLSLAAGDITQVLTSNDGTVSSFASGTTIDTISITTTGGKVLLIGCASVVVGTLNSGQYAVDMAIVKSSNIVSGSRQRISFASLSNGATGNFTCIAVDSPVAGTYTYTTAYIVQASGSSPSVFGHSFIAIELKA